MTTYIKKLVDSDGNTVLPRTRSIAVTMADGTTTLDETVVDMIIATDEVPSSPVPRVADTLLGLTTSVEELNSIDGLTANASELNILDGATLSTTELNYVDGVTSNIQTQLDGITPMSSYISFLSNTSTISNCGAFVPGSYDSLITKKLFLGMQIAKYMNEFLTDITLTPTEITLLGTKQTWYDICSDPTVKVILERSSSFMSKIGTIPFAIYVYSNWATLASFLAIVNYTYSTSFTSITDLKANTATMTQLMNNESLCSKIMFNSTLEEAFFGTAGSNITLLSGDGNFTVPTGITCLSYIMVSSGTSGPTGQGKILHGASTVTPGSSLAYSVAANGSAGTATTFNGLSTASGSQISSGNTGLLGPGTSGSMGGYGSAGSNWWVYGGGAGAGCGAGGGGGQGAASGCNGGIGGGSQTFLGVSATGGVGGSSGAGSAGTAGVINGTISPYVDSLMNITSYRPVRTNTILSQKQATLGIYGGGGGGASKTTVDVGAGGGGGGFGAAGGSGGWGTSNGVGSGGAGAGGAAGGNVTAAGQGAKGILFLMW